MAVEPPCALLQGQLRIMVVLCPHVHAHCQATGAYLTLLDGRPPRGAGGGHGDGSGPSSPHTGANK